MCLLIVPNMVNQQWKGRTTSPQPQSNTVVHHHLLTTPIPKQQQWQQKYAKGGRTKYACNFVILIPTEHSCSRVTMTMTMRRAHTLSVIPNIIANTRSGRTVAYKVRSHSLFIFVVSADYHPYRVLTGHHHLHETQDRGFFPSRNTPPPLPCTKRQLERFFLSSLPLLCTQWFFLATRHAFLV